MYRKICAALLAATSYQCVSEDIELYIGDAQQRSGTRPQVLIIFDTSGSMEAEETYRVDYNPADTDYSSDGYIYYTSDADDVPEQGDTRRFPVSENNCASSFSILSSIGKYNDKFLRFKSNSSEWKNVPANPSGYRNFEYIECQLDVDSNNLGNASGVIDGLPSNDAADLASLPPYAAAPITTPTFNNARTLYTSHYIDWYHNAPTTTKTRREIAREVVTNLIESAPGVSFGLQVFNLDYSTSDSGGRIVYGIKDEEDYNSSTLVTMIDDEIEAHGATPLCETLYEASLYFGGNAILYGNAGGTKIPAKDPSVSNASNVYISPYAGCSNEISVILMTDGEPTNDTDVDSLVDALAGTGSGNRLDELAGWMYNSDINSNVEGRQYATTYTIGFGEAVNTAGDLLSDTAANGGGEYYAAENPGDLVNSLQSALLEILNLDSSFTAPSVASNNYDKTETLDSVYYAMFLPDEGAAWRGNLKKLKVIDGEQVGRDLNSAIDTDGNISQNTKTFWVSDTDADGNDVESGGVVGMFRTLDSRTVYSDLSGSMVDLNRENLIAHYTTEALAADAFDVETSQLDYMINWARGHDVDDDDGDTEVDDMREGVFGDPLHSKPLVINYGGSETNQDVRILVGTNAGALHMFKDTIKADHSDTVTESWAFMPKEFFTNYTTLKDDLVSSDKVYGIDSPPTAFIFDADGDGEITGSRTDTDGVVTVTDEKAWVFFGLRRGGSSYYALDLTNPDSPKLLWQIDNTVDGFEELAQSWSQPKVGYSRLNIVNGVPKPVLIFGGGYSGARKDLAGVGQYDESGRAIYMVDAESGALLWSVSPAQRLGVNTQFTGFKDSIPSSIAVLDSDADGLIDRLYTGDTGGNVWRIDMPGNTPFDSENGWTVFQLAELGGDTNATDRRFFSEPSIVRTYITDTIKTSTTVAGVTTNTITQQERPYDAILLGSGDRSTPSSEDTSDKFFMIKDENIVTQSYNVGATAPAAVIPDVIKVDDLYDYTNNPFEPYEAPLTSTEKAALESLQVAVSLKSGWYVDFEADGEKSTAPALAINNVAYFTSFSPGGDENNSCSLDAGAGKLYAIDLALGTTVHNWRTWDISTGVPDTPSIIITKDPEVIVDPPEPGETEPPGEQRSTIKLLAGKIIPLDISLTTSRNYLYIKED